MGGTPWLGSWPGLLAGTTKPQEHSGTRLPEGHTSAHTPDPLGWEMEGGGEQRAQAHVALPAALADLKDSPEPASLTSPPWTHPSPPSARRPEIPPSLLLSGGPALARSPLHPCPSPWPGVRPAAAGQEPVSRVPGHPHTGTGHGREIWGSRTVHPLASLRPRQQCLLPHYQ